MPNASRSAKPIAKIASPLAPRLALAAVAIAATTAASQEATNTPAATQPAQGGLYLRQKVQYFNYGSHPRPELTSNRRDISKIVSTTSLTYGLLRDTSITLDLPFVYSTEKSDDGRDRAVGIADLALTVKHRPIQIDLNPIDSIRFAAFGGIEIPSYDSDFSSESWDPFVGGVFTAILGRHGINQSLSYKFNTGSGAPDGRPGDGRADALRHDTAYLFRIDPPEYTAETTAATYLTLELNGLYETNGDYEAILAPGILYEARTFALEATLGLPIIHDVNHRPRTHFALTFGLRILF
jgi:hypothetical protein